MSRRVLWCAWLALALLVLTFCATLILISPRFLPHGAPSDMPILVFAFGYSAVALIFLAVFPLLIRSWEYARGGEPPLLFMMFSIGLFGRLILIWSEPILEVDYNRYLWDGGLLANGFNPFSVAPADISGLPYNDIRLELSKAAGFVFERISYPELRTVYPPVAQLSFALAHLLEPWSLTSWRIVCVLADVATFTLIVKLLREVGASPLNAVLYWWHPLVLKEMVNSAHMEAVLLPAVLGAVLLAVRRQNVLATIPLALAVGTKLWPALMLPLILRPLFADRRRLMAALTIFGSISLTLFIPIGMGGLDRQSGFVGFATQWSTNSFLFVGLIGLFGALSGGEVTSSFNPGLLLRIISAVAIVGLSIALAVRAASGGTDLVRRVFLLVSAVVLLSPVQFPWYVLWVLPLAVLQGGAGWFVAAGLLPIYYASFYFRALGAFAPVEPVLTALIWIPAWIALYGDWCRARRPFSGSSVN